MPYRRQEKRLQLPYGSPPPVAGYRLDNVFVISYNNEVEKYKIKRYVNAMGRGYNDIGMKFHPVLVGLEKWGNEYIKLMEDMKDEN